MFALSFSEHRGELNAAPHFDRQVEEFNRQSSRQLFISNSQEVMDAQRSSSYFSYIDSLSVAIDQSHDTQLAVRNLLLRAIAYSAIQNYEGAIEDLSTYLHIDSTSVLALWQRAVCQSRINQFQASEGTNTELKNANVLADFNHALALSPQNAYLLYDRGNQHAQRKAYESAIADFTAAIAIEPNMAEAYYNRGLCLIYHQRVEEGIRDLSKAGELGLYTAYSIIKKYSK